MTCTSTFIASNSFKKSTQFLLRKCSSCGTTRKGKQDFLSKKTNLQGKKINNVAICDSLIHRSDRGNVNDGMNIKFSLCQSQGGKVIQKSQGRCSPCGHMSISLWSGEQINICNKGIDISLRLKGLIRCQRLCYVYCRGYIKVICVSWSVIFCATCRKTGWVQGTPMLVLSVSFPVTLLSNFHFLEKLCLDSKIIMLF